MPRAQTVNLLVYILYYIFSLYTYFWPYIGVYLYLYIYIYTSMIVYVKDGSRIYIFSEVYSKVESWRNCGRIAQGIHKL